MTETDRNLTVVIKSLYESGFMDMVADQKEFLTILAESLKEYVPGLSNKGGAAI